MISDALVLLCAAQDKIDEAARFQDDVGYRGDLQDISDDLTRLVRLLRTFDPRRQP